MSGLAGRGRRGREHSDAARELLRRLAGDDPRSVLELLDPDVDLVTAKPLAGAGSFHGQPGFLRWLERWDAAWDRRSLRIALIEPVGRRHVIASGEQLVRGGDSRVDADAAIVAFTLETRAGHIARWHAHESRAAALADARGGEAAASG